MMDNGDDGRKKSPVDSKQSKQYIGPTKVQLMLDVKEAKVKTYDS